MAAETVKERQTVMDQVSAMVQNKLKSDLDLSFANVNLAQAKLLQIQAQNGLNIAIADLARAMGSSSPRPYTLADVSLPPAPPGSAATLVTEALQNRPEIMGLRFHHNAAIKFQRAERDLLATLSAVGVAPDTSPPSSR